MNTQGTQRHTIISMIRAIVLTLIAAALFWFSFIHEKAHGADNSQQAVIDQAGEYFKTTDTASLACDFDNVAGYNQPDYYYCVESQNPGFFSTVLAGFVGEVVGEAQCNASKCGINF